jgi:hypothetical protein
MPLLRGGMHAMRACEMIRFLCFFFFCFRSSVTFAEVECTGPGSEMDRRVGWEKRLTEEEAQRFVDIKFIDDGWLSNQP